ncbi:hypothetical protein VF21_10654 [Pseudogymnoascus sp. 05NY08]|nr:hypothetical protein VF21_10654 [Pseudogymnoascus sp. 05NY08]
MVLLAAKAATPPNPIAIKATAVEIRRVVSLATASMLKFCSLAKLLAYIESCALRAAVKDSLEKMNLALVGQEKTISGLNGVASVVDAVGDLVERAVAAAKLGGGRGKKGRKKGVEEDRAEVVADLR